MYDANFANTFWSPVTVTVSDPEHDVRQAYFSGVRDAGRSRMELNGNPVHDHCASSDNIT